MRTVRSELPSTIINRKSPAQKSSLGIGGLRHCFLDVPLLASVSDAVGIEEVWHRDLMAELDANPLLVRFAGGRLDLRCYQEVLRRVDLLRWGRGHHAWLHINARARWRWDVI